MRTISARFSREGSEWVVELADEPRVHSYGHSLTKARAMILEAAALWYQVDVRDLELVGVYDVGSATADVDGALRARRAAVAADQVATAATQRTIGELIETGLSLRDIADIFGISHQRVHQLATGVGAGRPGVVRLAGGGSPVRS